MPDSESTVSLAAFDRLNDRYAECFADRERLRAERDRLRAELQEAHTWLEGAGIDDCEHRGYEGTKLCRFAETLRDIPDGQQGRLSV